jgi:hypothetical protein
MKTEIASEVVDNETVNEKATVADKQPEAEGKLLLGKRVLRHFGVRSDVQAGTYSSVARCR